MVAINGLVLLGSCCVLEGLASIKPFARQGKTACVREMLALLETWFEYFSSNVLHNIVLSISLNLKGDPPIFLPTHLLQQRPQVAQYFNDDNLNNHRRSKLVLIGQIPCAIYCSLLGLVIQVRRRVCCMQAKEYDYCLFALAAQCLSIPRESMHQSYCCFA